MKQTAKTNSAYSFKMYDQDISEWDKCSKTKIPKKDTIE